MKVLIDTNVYSHGMRGEPACADLLQSADEIVLSPIVVGELYFGFRHGNKEERNRDQFARFLDSSRVAMTSVTERTSEYFALVATQLKDTGTPIPTNDIWIAASAMELGLHLATLDSHFHYVKGLLLWK